MRSDALYRLLHHCGPVFEVDDARAAAARCGIGAGRLSILLRRSVQDGLLQRVKRGVYAVADPTTGVTPPHPFVVGVALARPSAVSGLAALYWHGHARSLPETIEVSTPQRIPTPVLARGRFRVVSVLDPLFIGVERHRIGGHDVPIFCLERALIDLFVAPRRFGGAVEALAVFEEAFARVDRDRLLAYSELGGAQLRSRVKAAVVEFAHA